MIDLNHLRNLLGDDATVARFLDIFREQAPAHLNDLRNCAEWSDWQGAGIAAHGLKSQLRYLGLDYEANLAYEIERRAEAGEMPMGTLEDLEDKVWAVLDRL